MTPNVLLCGGPHGNRKWYDASGPSVQAKVRRYLLSAWPWSIGCILLTVPDGVLATGTPPLFSRTKRIVPFRADGMRHQTELFHILLGDPLAFLIEGLIKIGFYFQPRRRCCPPNVTKHNTQRFERLSCPIDAYLAEQPMLDGVPF